MTNKYNTNLATEFLVLSYLIRQNLEASLTLGNKKEVDIIVNSNGRQVTIDVKGSVSSSSYFLKPIFNSQHFFVFVTFKNKIEDLVSLPEVYVVPAKKIKNLLSKNAKSSKVNYKALKNSSFLNAWHLIKENLKKT